MSRIAARCRDCLRNSIPNRIGSGRRAADVVNGQTLRFDHPRNQRVKSGLRHFPSFAFMFFRDRHSLDLILFNRYICADLACPAVAGALDGIGSIFQIRFRSCFSLRLIQSQTDRRLNRIAGHGCPADRVNFRTVRRFYCSR